MKQPCTWCSPTWLLCETCLSGAAASAGDGSKEQHEEEEQQEAAAEEEEPPLEWPHCMDDLGATNKLCSEALQRVMRACPGSAQLLWGNSGGHTRQESFLPFLTA